MNHSLGILSSGVKFVLHLVHSMTNFELQLQEATKFFNFFWLQLVGLKSSKKQCPWFLITFLLFEILAYITYYISVLKIENPSEHKKHTFLRNRGYGFAQRLFPQIYTAFKGTTLKFFELELKHCALSEKLQRVVSKDLYFFIGTVTLIHLQD